MYYVNIMENDFPPAHDVLEEIDAQKNKCKCIANAIWKIEKHKSQQNLDLQVQSNAREGCRTKWGTWGKIMTAIKRQERKRELTNFVKTIDKLFR